MRPNLSLNLGLRWTYSSPFKTKYDQQSQFDPNAIDPVTGLKGAITHPTGIIGKRDLNNFQPRARTVLELSCRSGCSAPPLA